MEETKKNVTEVTKKETEIDYERLYHFVDEKKDELENEIAKLKQEIELWRKIVEVLITNTNKY